MDLYSRPTPGTGNGSLIGESQTITEDTTPRELLPLQEWKELLLGFCRSDGIEEIENMLEPEGYRPLRAAICRYLFRTKAVRCHAGQIFVFAHRQQALNAITRLLIKPGDTVAVQNIGDLDSRNVFLAKGAEVVSLRTDEDGLAVDSLNEIAGTVKLVCTTPACQPPLGHEISTERRLALLGWAQQRQSLILEDAADSDYHYGGDGMPSLQGQVNFAPVIYLYSFARLLHPLTNLTIVIVPLSLLAAFKEVREMESTNASFLESYTLTSFIHYGCLEAYIKRTQLIYQQRRRALIFAFASMLHGVVDILPNTAGKYLVVRFCSRLSGQTIMSAARMAQLQMRSTEAMYAKSPPLNEYVLPFALHSEEVISEQVCAFATQIKSVTPLHFTKRMEIERGSKESFIFSSS